MSNQLFAQTYLKQKISVQELSQLSIQYGMGKDISKFKGLIFCDRSYVERYFQTQSKAIKLKAEREKFEAELQKNVTTISEYYALINKYPLVKESMIKGSNLSQDGWELRASTEMTRKFRVYKSKENGISFINANLPIDDDEKLMGTRIDKAGKN